MRRPLNVFILYLLCGAIAMLTMPGCAGITPPTAEEMVNKPLGNDLKIGMSKAEVETQWGKPDDIKIVENKERWQGARELWTYRAKYGSVVPISIGYLSKTQNIYFDGDHLTNIEEE